MKVKPQMVSEWVTTRAAMKETFWSLFTHALCIEVLISVSRLHKYLLILLWVFTFKSCFRIFFTMSTQLDLTWWKRFLSWLQYVVFIYLFVQFLALNCTCKIVRTSQQIRKYSYVSYECINAFHFNVHVGTMVNFK